MLKTIKGILKTFWFLTKSDWEELDHKLLRIASSAIGFILMALFWLYFIKNIVPF